MDLGTGEVLAVNRDYTLLNLFWLLGGALAFLALLAKWSAILDRLQQWGFHLL